VRFRGFESHLLLKKLSGQRDSNARHQPWQGCALPLSYARNCVIYDTKELSTPVNNTIPTHPMEAVTMLDLDLDQPDAVDKVIGTATISTKEYTIRATTNICRIIDIIFRLAFCFLL
jgi:hypothetical protein